MVLPRCCFHQLVDNSMLYKKKDIQHFYIVPIFFLNKIIRSEVGGKVDGQNLFGVRSEKQKKNNLVPGDKVYTNNLVPNENDEKSNLAVKGLRDCYQSQKDHMATTSERSNIDQPPMGVAQI